MLYELEPSFNNKLILLYIVPTKEGFLFDYIENEENKTIKIIIKKKIDENKQKKLNDSFDKNKDKKNNKDNKINMNQVIQTKEMTKEVLYSMTNRLKFILELYDPENENFNSNNIYLSIIMPIQKKDKSEEEDDFKDEDISEMVQNDLILLEDKLKRNFPNNENLEQKKSNDSTYNGLISKNGKDNSESSIYLQKNEKLLNINLINNKNNLKKYSDNSLNMSNEIQKKFLSSNKTNDSFLNKCLLSSEIKKSEKDNKEKDIFKHHKIKSDNLLKLNKVNPKINSLYSEKNIFLQDFSPKNDLEIKSQELTGVFTKINNLGLSEELDINDGSISNITAGNKNNKKEYQTKKIHHSIPRGSEIKESIKSLVDLEIIEKTKHSSNIKSTNQEIKNSKCKSSNLNSEIMERENKNVNINIHNNIINIINEHSLPKSNLKKNKTLKKSNKKVTHLCLKNSEIIQKSKCNLPEIDQNQPKRLSQNANPHLSQKDCMTFFVEDKKDNISQSNNQINKHELSLEENNKNNKSNIKSISNLEEDLNENEESKDYNKTDEEKEEEEEENTCNCRDILIVDDEEFNVMASRGMIKRIGYESDVAYNGEECLNLIKEKQKMNCKCGRNFYKIILLDIVMPVLDGIKAAKKIQEMIDKKEINENINIIFISGNIDGKDLKESLLKINCVKECLQKPVRIDKYQKLFEKYYKPI